MRNYPEFDNPKKNKARRQYLRLVISLLKVPVELAKIAILTGKQGYDIPILISLGCAPGNLYGFDKLKVDCQYPINYIQGTLAQRACDFEDSFFDAYIWDFCETYCDETVRQALSMMLKLKPKSPLFINVSKPHGRHTKTRAQSILIDNPKLLKASLAPVTAFFKEMYRELVPVLYTGSYGKMMWGIANGEETVSYNQRAVVLGWKTPCESSLADGSRACRAPAAGNCVVCAKPCCKPHGSGTPDPRFLCQGCRQGAIVVQKNPPAEKKQEAPNKAHFNAKGKLVYDNGQGVATPLEKEGPGSGRPRRDFRMNRRRTPCPQCLDEGYLGGPITGYSEGRSLTQHLSQQHGLALVDMIEKYPALESMFYWDHDGPTDNPMEAKNEGRKCIVLGCEVTFGDWERRDKQYCNAHRSKASRTRKLSGEFPDSNNVPQDGPKFRPAMQYTREALKSARTLRRHRAKARQGGQESVCALEGCEKMFTPERGQRYCSKNHSQKARDNRRRGYTGYGLPHAWKQNTPQGRRGYETSTSKTQELQAQKGIWGWLTTLSKNGIMKPWK